MKLSWKYYFLLFSIYFLSFLTINQAIFAMYFYFCFSKCTSETVRRVLITQLSEGEEVFFFCPEVFIVCLKMHTILAFLCKYRHLWKRFTSATTYFNNLKLVKQNKHSPRLYLIHLLFWGHRTVKYFLFWLSMKFATQITLTFSIDWLRVLFHLGWYKAIKRYNILIGYRARG